MNTCLIFAMRQNYVCSIVSVHTRVLEAIFLPLTIYTYQFTTLILEFYFILLNYVLTLSLWCFYFDNLYLILFLY